MQSFYVLIYLVIIIQYACTFYRWLVLLYLNFQRTTCFTNYHCASSSRLKLPFVQCLSFLLVRVSLFVRKRYHAFCLRLVPTFIQNSVYKYTTTQSKLSSFEKKLTTRVFFIWQKKIRRIKKKTAGPSLYEKVYGYIVWCFN